MKRIDQWKIKLKAAKSDLRHKKRQFNSAQRSLNRTVSIILELERKINAYMANVERQTQRDD